MDAKNFQANLNDLLTEMGSLPESERQKLEALAEETRQRKEKLKQTVGTLQDSIDYLRLSVKYLLFDLEATRRENAQLRRMFEEESES